LQHFVKDYGIEDNGLKKLTANVLGFKISKRQQTSNWEAEQLSAAQLSMPLQMPGFVMKFILH
jgi:ribonuclease D